MRGAQGLARNGLPDSLLAQPIKHVASVFAIELFEPRKHGRSGLVSDGAIRRIADHLGKRLQSGKRALIGLASNHPLEQSRQLGNAVAAGDALAARLRSARPKKR